MSILVFQHVSYETSAELGQFLSMQGHRLMTVPLYDRKAHVPQSLQGIKGLVSMGGGMNVEDWASIPWMNPQMDLIRQAHEKGIPIVGICLGAQLIAHALGGEVTRMSQPEVGWKHIELTMHGTSDPVLAGQPWESMQFHMHAFEVSTLPPDSVSLAGSDLCHNQVFRVGRNCYGFQFHFELALLHIVNTFSKLPLVGKIGMDPEQIVAQCDDYYPDYNRRNMYLYNMISTLLFKA